MISFRYHIVSITAVFLALGLGILLGSSVVSGAVDAQLSDNLTEARQERQQAEDRADEVQAEADQVREFLTEQVAPWGLDGRLNAGQILFVSDGTERAALREHVEDAVVAAGGQPVGTITLRDKWNLAQDADVRDLQQAFSAAGLSLDENDEPATAGFDELGKNLLQQPGQELIVALADKGFLSVDEDVEGTWPPSSSMVIVLSPSRRAETPSIPNAESLALSLGDATPTLVVTDRPEGQSVVTQLRQLSNGDRPNTLATFDAGADDVDPGGIGVVASMLAAADGQGGDWGTEGERFLPPNAGPPNAQDE